VQSGSADFIEVSADAADADADAADQYWSFRGDVGKFRSLLFLYHHNNNIKKPSAWLVIDAVQIGLPPPPGIGAGYGATSPQVWNQET